MLAQKVHREFVSREFLKTPSPGSGPRRRFPRPRRRLSGAAARGRVRVLLFRCVFFALSRAALRSLKKGGAAARSSPAGAEGMLTPRRARDAGPPVTSARSSPLLRGTGAGRAPPAALALLGRPMKVGPGTGFVQPARQSLSTERTGMSPSREACQSSTFPASYCPSPALLPP